MSMGCKQGKEQGAKEKQLSNSIVHDICTYMCTHTHVCTLPWPSLQVSSLIFRSQNQKCAHRRLRSNMPHADETHRQLWPGIEVPKQPDYKSARSSAAESDSQDVWFYYATITTSMFIASMVACINRVHRPLQDRAHTCESFSKLIHVLAALSGSLTFDHTRFGDNVHGGFSITASGLMHGASFWTEEFYEQFIAKVWRKKAHCTKTTWIISESGLNLCQFAELLCFCFDPMLHPNLKDMLIGRACQLMTQFASFLDSGSKKVDTDHSIKSATTSKRSHTTFKAI